MVECYTKGIVLPVMRPVPLPIPKPVKWWNVWGGLKNFAAKMKPRQWEIMEDYELKVPWRERPLCCPQGFIFDGASVPRVLWPIMSPTGTMFLAGLFHDLGYRYNCWFDINYNQRVVGAGKAFFDSQFEQIGSFVNDAKIAPNLAWFGLAVGGWLAWNGRRKEGHNASVEFPPKKVENFQPKVNE